MYNHHLEVSGKGDIQLRLAIALAFQHIPGKKLESYIEDGPSILQLFWHQTGEAHPLPFTHNAEQTFELVKGWLQSRDNEAYLESAGDMDGSEEPKGFRLLATEDAGSGGSPYLAIQVSPIWCHYPK